MHRCFRFHFALVLVWTLSHRVVALASTAAKPSAPSSKESTVQAAMRSVTDFLPVVKPSTTSASVTVDPSEPIRDLLPAYAGIHQAYQDALVALTSEVPTDYTAVLTSDYQQEGPDGKTIGKAEMEKRLGNAVQRNRFTETRFGIIGLQRTAPDRATATIQEHIEFYSRNTPAAVRDIGNGRKVVINNTAHTTMTLLLEQTWVQHGQSWQLADTQALQITIVTVL